MKLNYSKCPNGSEKITEQGSYFVTQALEYTVKGRRVWLQLDNFMVGPFVEDFKKQLKIGFGSKKIKIVLELNI